MQSPHGVLFMVTSCISEAIYTCVITGDLLPSNYVIPESNNNTTTANSTSGANTESIQESSAATSPTTDNKLSTAASNSESTYGSNANINNASISDTNLEAGDE